MDELVGTVAVGSSRIELADVESGSSRAYSWYHMLGYVGAEVVVDLLVEILTEPFTVVVEEIITGSLDLDPSVGQPKKVEMREGEKAPPVPLEVALWFQP